MALLSAFLAIPSLPPSLALVPSPPSGLKWRVLQGWLVGNLHPSFP